MCRGVDQELPPFDDSVNSTWGSAVVPSTYDMTILFVASVPSGAPFAISTEGPVDKSLRAPAIPSSGSRGCTGSSMPGCWMGRAAGTGGPHVAPPLVDFTMNSNGWPPELESVPIPNTYTFP